MCGYSSHGVTSLIIIQPTPFCNLNCSYCYLSQRTDTTALTIDQIGAMFEKLLTFPTVSDCVTVVWHGGEPMVLGIAYYEAAFARIRDCCPPGLKVELAFQTNATLIDDAWCDLFLRWGVGICASIDGPRHINDAFRKTRAGKGTYDRTVAGLKCLQRRGIPFAIIAVLTKMALEDPDAVFSFFEEMDICDVAFNIEEIEGVNTRSSLSNGFDESTVVRFFARFSELMKERKYAMVVRELDETLESIRYFDKRGPINNLIIPFGIITVDVNGGVYTFSPELPGYSSPEFPSFSIGNIFTDDFDTLQNSDNLKAMMAEINTGVELCRASCEYFAVCGGGTPANKVFENGSFASSETLHCRLTKKRITDFVLAAFEAGPAA